MCSLMDEAEQKDCCFLPHNPHSAGGAGLKLPAPSSINTTRHPSVLLCFHISLQMKAISAHNFQPLKPCFLLEAPVNTCQLLNTSVIQQCLCKAAVSTRFLWSQSPKICHTLTLSMVLLTGSCLSGQVTTSIICPCPIHRAALQADYLQPVWMSSVQEDKCSLNCRAGSGWIVAMHCTGLPGVAFAGSFLAWTETLESVSLDATTECPVLRPGSLKAEN